MTAQMKATEIAWNEAFDALIASNTTAAPIPAETVKVWLLHIANAWKSQPVLDEKPAAKTGTVTIVFDGGSLGNGSSTSDAYGSYQLEMPELGKSDVVRLQFKRGHTNNEAEYETLLEALTGAVENTNGIGSTPDDFDLVIKGDSKIVLNQIRKVLGLPGEQWKCNEPRLAAYRDEAAKLIRRFQSVDLVWQPREDSVRVLGH